MSSMFWASLAGARADDNETLEENYRAWKSYAQEQETRANHLERQVGQLQSVLGQWQDEAVDNNGRLNAVGTAFQEVTGVTFREYYGDQEADKRVNAAKESSREGYGLKK